jgi:hypothetical protein
MAPHEIEPRSLAVLADEIRTEVAAAEGDFQSAVQHAINAGLLLIEAKDLVGHGGWGAWLEANFDATAATARTYMRLAANRKRVFDLPSIRQSVALLAGEPEVPGLTPDEVDDLESALGTLPEAVPAEFRGEYAITDEELVEQFRNRARRSLRMFVLMYEKEVGVEVERQLERLKREWGMTSARDVFLEALRRADPYPSEQGTPPS